MINTPTSWEDGVLWVDTVVQYQARTLGYTFFIQLNMGRVQYGTVHIFGKRILSCFKMYYTVVFLDLKKNWDPWKNP